MELRIRGMQMKHYMKIATLVMGTVLCLLPLSAQVSSASSLQTVYSKSFDGMPYKEIDIDLGAEDFTLRRTASDKMTLEINARVNDNIPLVMQDTKSLKVIQKNKKRKVDGQICMVVLTLPKDCPLAEFELSLTSGAATLDPLGAEMVEIGVGNGTLTAQDIRADKEFELSVKGGMAMVASVITNDAEIAADTGSITVGRVSADKQMRLATNAGIVKIENPKTKSLFAAVKRGSLMVKDAFVEEFSVAVDSGTAALALAKPFSRSSSLLVGAGSITLGLPKGSVFYSTATVGKGHFASEFTLDSSGPELKVKVGKGTVEVKWYGGYSTQQAVVPVTEEYNTSRELLDWYTSLGSLRTRTSDAVPASVVVDVVLGYKKEDKATSTEITQRSLELRDFLRRYFTQKTAEELAPQNEEHLKIEIRNAINDHVLSSSKIKDVRFMQLDVITQ